MNSGMHGLRTTRCGAKSDLDFCLQWKAPRRRRGAPPPPRPGRGRAPVAEDIEVAPELVGALVGKQGASIMELQRSAGAGVHIQIQQPARRGGPQMATVTGSSSGVAYGARLVRERLREIQQQRALYDSERAAQGQSVPTPAPSSQAAAWHRGPSAPAPGAPARPPTAAAAAPTVGPQQALVALLQALLPGQGQVGGRPPQR